MSGLSGAHRSTLLFDEDGQMAVEFAVLLPVIIAVALLAFNLLRFTDLCARFDRLAYDATLTQGVSPTGQPSMIASTEAIRAALTTAMDDESCEIDVRGVAVSEGADSGFFDLSAGTTRFECELGYRPWPARIAIAGFVWEAPALLKHTRSLVVDRYKAGVIA